MGTNRIPDADFSIIILAGGHSRRFSHKIKALQEFQGQTLLARRIMSLVELSSGIFVSASSEEICNKYTFSLQSAGINLSKIVFYVDKIEDQGPMKALCNIIPKLTTRYALVIGVDNLMISLKDIRRLVEIIESYPISDLITVSINMERLISSFFAFDVFRIKKLLIDIPQSSEFERLTDLFRIVDKILILNVKNEGQFINVNTPAQLNNLDPEQIEFSLPDQVYSIEPKYFDKFGTSCLSFKNEIKSWSLPEIIPHIKENILRDAKKLLAELYEECNFSELF